MSFNLVAEKSIAYFSETGWPACLLFTGQNTQEKIEYIKTKLIDELYAKRIQKNLSREAFSRLINSGDYPDLYIFPREKIYIGDPENPAPKTIRHMQRHFLPYAPYYSALRFVFFSDARWITDEGISALLKNLEEPPKGTHFILSTHEEEDLKETIVSRSLVISLPFQFSLQKIPPEAWKRFWYFMEYEHPEILQLAESKNWLKKIEKAYDELSFTKRDYLIFDKLFVSEFRKEFSRELAEVQAQLFELTLKPLYYAIRDILIAGPVPELGPWRLVNFPKEKILTLYQIVQNTIYLLRTKVYGNLPLNINVISGEFLWKLMQTWA